jgi:hypothetical protein
MVLRRVVDKEPAVLLEPRVEGQPEQPFFVHSFVERDFLADIEHLGRIFDSRIVREDEHSTELRDDSDPVAAVRRISEIDRAFKRKIRKRTLVAGARVVLISIGSQPE